MKRALEFLATRVLRSRTGAAVVLAGLVLGVLVGARALSGPADSGPATTPAEPLVIATAADDDGVHSSGAPSPTTIPGAATPEAVAKAFALNWVAHTGVSAEEWHSRLVSRSTPALADQLSGVDPQVVPAERLTGEPVVVPKAPTLVDVVISVDSGELRLRLVVDDGRWLVDGVDWGRA